MSPKTELTYKECCALHLELTGRPITEATWRGYVSRHEAPAPKRHVGRTPVFDAGKVRAYILAKQKGPGRPYKTPREQDPNA